ncbi:plasma membrane SNARE (Sec9) [Cordyceps militaris]|uniref:Plasma membrane SNARE (Sec9) n=1 Tax=Cordyceps militaris TaxID=73501 RepID=A0A2H4SG61_CORMI|nr:plasma membrane SNARE (Sec9) [Cordyceps militaris]
MKKFGFGKKGGDDGDDASRNALFGSRKKSSTPAAQTDNPYAQQGAQGAADPYADSAKYANVTPYQQARSQLGGGAAPGAGQQDPPGRAPGYAGYSSDKYGSGGGYGSNRYESNVGADRNAASTAGARGPGGYGGFGRNEKDEQDSNREALLGGAQERFAQRQQTTATTATSSGYGQSGPSTASQDSYGGYGDQRELTAEEQDEAETQGILAEKRQVQQESSASVSRSVQMARQANEVGRATLARLGAQGERLHNTEKNLDLAANQNKIAQDRAAELKTLNRSMFAVHVSNPFTSKQRQQKADDDVMNRHRAERDQRETTRREGFSANQRMESNFRDMSTSSVARPQQRAKKDYGKFNLEDEEGADELEDQIDDGINQLEGQVSMMNMVGRAIGKEVDSQNKQIDRIMTKVCSVPWCILGDFTNSLFQSDAVDDATRMNRERLARIK